MVIRLPNIFSCKSNLKYIKKIQNLNLKAKLGLLRLTINIIEKGVSSSKKIYSFYNCKPKCGKCIDLMNCIVEKEGDKIKTF